MRIAVARFLQFLAVERNASSYTVKSYREDLTARPVAGGRRAPET